MVKYLHVFLPFKDAVRFLCNHANLVTTKGPLFSDCIKNKVDFFFSQYYHKKINVY